jgi:hypothetical protein
MAGQERADAPGPGIVSRRGETEIAELGLQVVQITRRIFQRLDRIERIGKPAVPRRRRHELRDALRALPAHRKRIEAALLPDDASEELDRQCILRRVLLDGAANVVRGGGSVWSGWWCRLISRCGRGGLALRRNGIILSRRRALRRCLRIGMGPRDHQCK